MTSYDVENTLQALHQLRINGNIIPHIWYKKITFDNGKPDLLAITILSDIVYWYRPQEIRDEQTGQLIGIKKKFKADMLQRSTNAIAEQFGMTRRQAGDALKRLADKGLIIKEQRQIKTPMGILPNVLFIAPVVETIAELQADIELIESSNDINTESGSGGNHDDYFIPISRLKQAASHANVRYAPSGCSPLYVETYHEQHPNVVPPTFKRMTYTEISTKNSTENTTKKAAAENSVNTEVVVANTKIAAAELDDLKNNSIQNLNITSKTCQLEKNFVNDAVIGMELTLGQRQAVEEYLDLNYETFLNTVAAKPNWLQAITEELLDPKTFTITGRNFQHKFNTIKRAIQTKQWFPKQIITIEVNKSTEQDQEIKVLKNEIRELELERDGYFFELKERWEEGSPMWQCRQNSLLSCEEKLKPLLQEFAVIEEMRKQKSPEVTIRQ